MPYQTFHSCSASAKFLIWQWNPIFGNGLLVCLECCSGKPYASHPIVIFNSNHILLFHFSSLHYIGGNSGNAFTITTNGTIITNIPLDRELQDRYELTIMATDRGVPALSTSVTAMITVIDTNDNAPNITNTPTEITIPENAPIGTYDIQAYNWHM